MQSIIIVELVGILAGILSSGQRQMYTNYVKPPLSPPGWLFGVVWTILYFLMGISIYIISQQKIKKAKNLFWFQLLINFIWPLVFFRLNMYWISVAVIILLDILVFATINIFYKINKLASFLMIPYLLWILFATYLNIGIAVLN